MDPSIPCGQRDHEVVHGDRRPIMNPPPLMATICPSTLTSVDSPRKCATREPCGLRPARSCGK
jgi:hypothetical protein